MTDIKIDPRRTSFPPGYGYCDLCDEMTQRKTRCVRVQAYPHWVCTKHGDDDAKQRFEILDDD